MAKDAANLDWAGKKWVFLGSADSKGGDMISQKELADDWLAEHHKQIIDCPYQPGSLKISKASCKRRFLAGLYVGGLNGDPMLYLVKKGLLLCAECPIGRKLGGNGRKKSQEELFGGKEGEFLLRRFSYGSFGKIRKDQRWKTGGGRAGVHSSGPG
jgi:hypothetical protein